MCDNDTMRKLLLLTLISLSTLAEDSFYTGFYINPDTTSSLEGTYNSDSYTADLEQKSVGLGLLLGLQKDIYSTEKLKINIGGRASLDLPRKTERMIQTIGTDVYYDNSPEFEYTLPAFGINTEVHYEYDQDFSLLFGLGINYYDPIIKDNTTFNYTAKETIAPTFSLGANYKSFGIELMYRPIKFDMTGQGKGSAAGNSFQGEADASSAVLLFKYRF